MKRPAALLFILFISLLPLMSQSRERYKISGIVYYIDGKVRESSLNAVLDWDKTNIFHSRRDLESYIREKKKLLIDKRYFKSVIMDYEIIDTGLGYSSAEILVRLSTAWNLYPIPIYTYDSNYGTATGLNIYYNNFLGTLTNLAVTGYYSPGKSEFSSSLEGVRIGSFELNLSLSQSWEEVKSIGEDDNINLQYRYAKTVFDIGFLFPIIQNLNYMVTPTLYYPFAYDIEINDTDEEDDAYIIDGLIPSFSHMLQFDHVNWVGNLRQGFSVSLENGVDYFSVSKEYFIWVDGILKTYVNTPVMNYNSRVSSFYYRNGYREKSGDRLRGILDYKLTGTWGWFWNQNFVFPVVKVPLFFDLHLSPFADMGYVSDSSRTFKRDDMLYTAGVSFSVFPAPLPSVQINVDYGINLQDSSESEILISSVLYF